MVKFMAVVENIMDDIAVVDLGEGMISVPLKILPKGVIEGQVLEITISISEENTHQRKDAIKSIHHRLQNQ